MSTIDAPLEPFRTQPVVVMTTFKRDGTGVPTAVSIAVEGDVAFVRTWSTSGKARRLRNNPAARIAASTWGGSVTGPAVDVTAHEVDGATAARAAHLIRAKHPVLHGCAVPLAQRLTRRRTVYLELRPLERASQRTAA